MITTTKPMSKKEYKRHIEEVKKSIPTRGKEIKKLCDNYNKSTEDWEDYFPREIEKLLAQALKKNDEEWRKKLRVARNKWKKCERKKCDNKEECERANHYIEVIWNPTFKELLTHPLMGIKL